MTLSLCRAQEFYEAGQNHIRGRYFSWETFIDAFSDDDGKISYFSFWSGFNLPGQVYLNFLSTFRGDLSEREARVRNAVFGVVDSATPFYIIGTLEDSSDTLKHELLHALYHVNPEYRILADRLVDSVNADTRRKMENGLRAFGYGDNVLRDEIQAYLGSGTMAELQDRFHLNAFECETCGAGFRELAEQYLAGSVALGHTFDS